MACCLIWGWERRVVSSRVILFKIASYVTTSTNYLPLTSPLSYPIPSNLPLKIPFAFPTYTIYYTNFSILNFPSPRNSLSNFLDVAHFTPVEKTGWPCHCSVVVVSHFWSVLLVVN